jgi:hypothetical protein
MTTGWMIFNIALGALLTVFVATVAVMLPARLDRATEPVAVRVPRRRRVPERVEYGAYGETEAA